MLITAKATLSFASQVHKAIQIKVSVESGVMVCGWLPRLTLIHLQKKPFAVDLRKSKEFNDGVKAYSLLMSKRSRYQVTLENDRKTQKNFVGKQ